MKIILDDRRPFLENKIYNCVRTYGECALLIRIFHTISFISLDYDLGDKETGLDLLIYMLECGNEVKHINVHSDHSIGVSKMRAFVEKNFLNAELTFNYRIRSSGMSEFIIKEGVLQSYRGNSAEIIIPEGIHTIGMLAFSKDKKALIENIRFPKSLGTIGDWAFSNCEKLKRITIPSNVKKIGKGAFGWCRELSEVIIEDNPKVGDGAFIWSLWEENEFKKTGVRIDGNTLLRVDPELTEYTILSNIKVIGRDAFKNSKVKEVIVPYGVTKLDICAFAYSAVERISLPETLKIVDAYAFSHCTNLTELTIPKSVSQIDDNAFEGLGNCVLTILNESDDEELFRISPYAFGIRNPSIKEIRVLYGSAAMRYAMKCGLNVTTFPCIPKRFGNPKRYRYIDDVFCCEGNTLHEYFGHDEIVYVPDGIKVIGNNAFTGQKMKKVNLPDSVTYIDDLAFSRCDELEYIIGNGVQEVEIHAFHDCAKLEKVVFPSLKKYGDLAFERCDNLKSENMLFPPDVVVVKTYRRNNDY